MFFVYAQRRGASTPRVMAGPFRSRNLARELLPRVQSEAVARHYAVTHYDERTTAKLDSFYVGEVRPDLAARPAPINPLLHEARWRDGAIVRVRSIEA